MSWVIWAVVLLVQNFSSGLMTRARMTSSLRYSGLASVFSNATWFVAQFIAIDKITKLLESKAWWAVVGTAIFYVTFTVLGSLIAHHLSMKYFERRFVRAKEE
jgi:hypothetical protein